MKLTLEIKEHLIERCGLTPAEVSSLFERHVVYGVTNVLQLHFDQRELPAPDLRVEDPQASGQLKIVARDPHGSRLGN